MDPQQQQNMASMMAGMGAIFLLVGLVFLAAFIFLFWRIFTKAGMPGPLSLIVLVPGIGPLVVLCILAFADWKVAPVVPYGALPPQYPPPPAYPPANYPPPPSTL
jgi:hypothetical protein